MDWNSYFLDVCDAVATKSKDRSTKVGCVICGPDNGIRSTGYNGFPRGCDDSKEEWHQRPKKYFVTAHAEQNAVCQAAKNGTPLENSIAYVSLFPCAACTLALIQAGIVKIVAYDWSEERKSLLDWADSYKSSIELCDATTTRLVILPSRG